MTSLVFDLNPEFVLIAMDTLVTTVGENKLHHFCSKMFPLPHLGSVMCGTGNMELAVGWFKQIHHNFYSDVREISTLPVSLVDFCFTSPLLPRGELGEDCGSVAILVFTDRGGICYKPCQPEQNIPCGSIFLHARAKGP